MNIWIKITRIILCLPLLFVVIYITNDELMFGRSSYSYGLNVLDCNNLEYLKGCRHEIGHKMDDDMGWPSLTDEFAIATQAHVIVQTRPLEVPDDVAFVISLYPDRDPREIYAAIYASVDGHIERLPAALQPFYSTDQSYLTLYDCLSDHPGLNVCGLSFSYLRSQE